MKNLFLLSIACLVSCSVIVAHETIHHSGEPPEGRVLIINKLKEPIPKKVLEGDSVSYSNNKSVRFWLQAKAAETTPKKIISLTIRNKKREFSQVKLSDVVGECEASWVSEKLLFLRVHWDKEWGSDHILDIESGKTLYAEKFTKRDSH